MRFTSYLAAIGFASAAEELKFMNEQSFDDNTELLSIGNGACVNWSLTQKRAYDLKGFDGDNRDAKAHAPAHIDFTDGQFLYKACAPAFSFDQVAWTAAGETAPFKADDFKSVAKSTAYWVTGTAVDYTFNMADVAVQATTGGPVKDETTTNGLELVEKTTEEVKVVDTVIDHWTLTWTSEEKCKSAAKEEKFEVVLSATCDRSVTAGVFSNKKVEGCKATVDYKSEHACGKALPIDALAQLAPFIGAILIIFGGIMAFFGTKFLFYVFGAIIGLIVAGILFAVLYAVALPHEASTGLVAGVIVGCVLVGGVVAYFTQSFTRKFTVPILGAAAGIFSFLMLSKVFGLKELYGILMAIFGAIAGWYLAFKFNTIIKALGTAVVGSFMITRGLGCYLPGFPSGSQMNIETLKNDKNATMEMIGYLAAFVVLTIAGTIVQLKTQRSEDEEENADDAFKSQEEGRTCGCF